MCALAVPPPNTYRRAWSHAVNMRKVAEAAVFFCSHDSSLKCPSEMLIYGITLWSEASPHCQRTPSLVPVRPLAKAGKHQAQKCMYSYVGKKARQRAGQRRASSEGSSCCVCTPSTARASETSISRKASQALLNACMTQDCQSAVLKSNRLISLITNL